MKSSKYKIYIILISVIFFGCTNLDETTYQDISYNNFYNTRKEVLQAVLRPYTHMQAWLAPTGQNGYFYQSELSADQLAWPQKGRHGYDNGDHIRLHYHTWTADESRMRTTWSLIWTGIGFINSAINDLDNLNPNNFDMSEEEFTNIKAELRVLRAFHYLKAMDLWGNIPVVTKVGEPLEPETKNREEVFQFIQNELETNVPNLAKYDTEYIGRVNKAAGYAMLSELYLNAEKWIGKEMYQECIDACNSIINGSAGGLGGGPSLENNINSVFSNTNWESKENLFQVAYSYKNGFTFNWSAFFASYSYMKAVLNVDYSGWNAMVVIPSAFDMYNDKDQRKNDWFLFGPQYKLGTQEPVLGVEEYSGKPLIYVNSIRRESEGDLSSNGSMTEGEENSGARFHKYKSGTLNDPNYWENHYIIYRFTEIIFNKAEALMRINGGNATQEAVDLINSSRIRAFNDSDWPQFKYTTSSLTMDELLAERGREFIFEGKRRQDLIRFNKFTTMSWWDHTPSNSEHLTIFPIPNTQLGANPNLKQNPSY